MGQEVTVNDMQVPDTQGDISMQDIGMVFTVLVEGVLKDSPAWKAGIRQGDLIKKVDGMDITDAVMFTTHIRQSDGRPMTIVIERDGRERALEGVRAVANTVGGQTLYQVGLYLADSVPKIIGHPSPWAQFTDVVKTTGRTLGLLFMPLRARISGKKMPSGRANIGVEHMSGPLGILTMLWYKLKLEGLRGGLSFIILISFSLALFNLLPFPVLDGGHILFAAIEVIIRRRLPVKLIGTIQYIFAALLITLMLYITFFDGSRLYRHLRQLFGHGNQTEAVAAPKTASETAPPAAEAEGETEK
jgi:regulator of sigma E protease